MAENNEPPAGDPVGGRSPAQTPRRRISADRHVQDSPTGNKFGEQLADLVDSVKVLADHLSAEVAPPPENKERATRRIKKFQRRGPSEDQAADPANTAEGTSPDTGDATDLPPAAANLARRGAMQNEAIAWPNRPGTIAPPIARKLSVVARRRRHGKPFLLAVVNTALLCLLAVVFVLGRLTTSSEDTERKAPDQVHARSPDGGGAEPVTDRALETANAALSAVRRGDLDGAHKIYKDALDQHVDLPGMHYQLANLALQRGAFNEADIESERSREAGEFVAASEYIQARVAAVNGRDDSIVRHFGDAASADPFNSRYFFYWGEALRRRGQTQKAIEVLDRALDRAHSPAEDQLYRFKERLAKVEEDTDKNFNAEFEARLKQSPLSGEWALLAAAREIIRSTPAAAAPFLQKAAAALSVRTYGLYIKDYLFQTAQDEPTLSALLSPPPIPSSPEENALFFDPIVAPVELTDPAIWQTTRHKNHP